MVNNMREVNKKRAGSYNGSNQSQQMTVREQL